MYSQTVIIAEINHLGMIQEPCTSQGFFCDNDQLAVH